MENKNKVILDLCGGTGSWSEPYKKAGYNVKNITLPDYNVFLAEIYKTFLVFKGQGGQKILKLGS